MYKVFYKQSPNQMTLWILCFFTNIFFVWYDHCVRPSTLYYKLSPLGSNIVLSVTYFQLSKLILKWYKKCENFD